MRHLLAALVLVLTVSGCGDDSSDPVERQPQLETTDTAAPYPHVPTEQPSASGTPGAATEPARRYASAFAVAEDLEICETWYPQEEIGGSETVGCEEDGESIKVTWFADDAARDRYAEPGGVTLLGDEYAVACSVPATCEKLEKLGLGKLSD